MQDNNFSISENPSLLAAWLDEISFYMERRILAIFISYFKFAWDAVSNLQSSHFHSATTRLDTLCGTMNQIITSLALATLSTLNINTFCQNVKQLHSFTVFEICLLL